LHGDYKKQGYAGSGWHGLAGILTARVGGVAAKLL